MEGLEFFQGAVNFKRDYPDVEVANKHPRADQKRKWMLTKGCMPRDFYVETVKPELVHEVVPDWTHKQNE